MAFCWANQMNIEFIKAAAWWLITLLIALWWLSPDKDYQHELEKVVATCLSSSSGKPVIIGDEVYMCGVTSIGVKL